MTHGIKNEYLYLALKIDVGFANSNGSTGKKNGTAFFVRNKYGELCLITNRHMLDLSYKQTEPKWNDFAVKEIVLHCKKMDENGFPDKDFEFQIQNLGEFKFSKNYENDVACLKNITIKDFVGSDTRVNFNLEYATIATEYELNNSLSICDFVAFPGFPEWHDKKNKLPILRTGTIASDPRFNYSYDGNENGEVIAYEAFSYNGSSGSPVFAIQKGINLNSSTLTITGGNFRRVMLIGVNAGHLPVKGPIDIHSGISYFYKSTVILELIDN